MPTRKSEYTIPIHPIIRNPRECDGYPSVYIRQEPAHEVNFYIEECKDKPNNKLLCELQCNRKKGATRQQQLACSLIISSSSTISTNSSDNYEEGPEISSTNSKDVVHDHDHDHADTIQKQQLLLSELDKSKPVIIICHGLLSWRNQMLIANLASQLSSELSWHTLRFDFTASGHSSGTWKFADYQGDYRDLYQVARFVKEELGCRIGCIIGHSQGAAAVIKYANEHEHEHEHDNDGGGCCYVNLAGRFTVPNDYKPEAVFTEEQCKDLKENGKFTLLRKGASGDRSLEVTAEDVENRILYDISSAVHGLDEHGIKMLTIHGDQDKQVPVENAYKFDAVIPNHSLHIVKGADHNFNGLRFMDDIVSSIASFVIRIQS